MSAQVKLVPSRSENGKQLFIVMVGAKMLGSFASVAAAKAFLRKKFGSRFQESTINPVRRKKRRKANMSQGITRGTGRTRVFHPIRSAPDYDPSLLSGAEGKKARSGLKAIAKKRKAAKTKGLKAIKSKSTVKAKTATKKRKAKRAVGMFGLKAKSKKNPKLHHARKAYRYTIQDATSATRITDSLAAAKKLFVAMKKRKPHEYIDLYDTETGNFVEQYRPTGGVSTADRRASGKKRSNPKKRAIPAAFKAAAQRAKAMTPAQRSAWAKKMQAARKAKRKLKR
jgi:hypothetical protein